MSTDGWNPDRWTSRERLAVIVAQEINDAPAEELIKAATDDELRAWAAKIRAVGQAKGWSTWAADYMDPDAEFVDVGVPPLDEINKAEGVEKDTSGDRQPTAGESTPATAELLAHATAFEVPRPGNRLPLLLQRSYAGGDRWAICDREGRRWDRDHGWMYEGQHLDERTRSDTRFPLAEAWKLAHRIAATDLQSRCQRNVVDGDFGDHFFKRGALSDSPIACRYCGARKGSEPVPGDSDRG